MSGRKTSPARKRVASLVWALVFIVLFGAAIGFVLWCGATAPLPRLLVALYVVIYGSLIVGIIIALIQRLREIKKGEEDEAAQY